MTRIVRIRRPGALTFVVGLATAAWTAEFSATAFGWISAHSEISRAAWKVQPQALQDLWSKPFRLPNGKESSRPISEYLISRWSGAPDSAASRKSRDEFLYYEGDWLYHYFVFSPEENRGRAERGARWYFEHIIAAFREGRPQMPLAMPADSRMRWKTAVVPSMPTTDMPKNESFWRPSMPTGVSRIPTRVSEAMFGLILPSGSWTTRT